MKCTSGTVIRNVRQKAGVNGLGTFLKVPIINNMLNIELP